jgi:SAM-dependent methyltransferase
VGQRQGALEDVVSMPNLPKGDGRSLGDFDQYAGSYDAAVNRAIGLPGLSVDFFTAAKIGYINDFLERRFAPDVALSLLDVGCGVGNFHEGLKAANRRISGIDISRESLETAIERHPGVDYRHYDGTNVPYEAATFDFAFAVCVYHHIPAALRAPLTADIKRVLKPGACFAILEHNPLNPLTRRVVDRCPFDADAVLLKRQDAEDLLRGAGFTDVTTRFILTVPLKGRTGRRIDSLFAGIPLGSQYMTTGRS